MERSFPFFRIIGLLIFLGIIGAAVYYLFFAPTPAIDAFAPPQLQTLEQVSATVVDIDSLLESATFRSLQVHAPDPGVGSVGRTNPFLRF